MAVAVQAAPTATPRAAAKTITSGERWGTGTGVVAETGTSVSAKFAARKSGLVKIGRGAVVVVVSGGGGGASTGGAISSTGGGGGAVVVVVGGCVVVVVGGCVVVVGFGFGGVAAARVVGGVAGRGAVVGVGVELALAVCGWRKTTAT